jgi:hypothetical protein
MLNFVCHYKLTKHFSSDELGKNSSTYDVVAIVCNCFTQQSEMKKQKYLHSSTPTATN